MPNFAVDGLVSGLDTTSLINQLMQIEAAPQSLLKSKSSETSKLVSALQSLNSKVASLSTAAAAAAELAAWSLHSVKSSSDAVAATTTADAQPSSLAFRVKQLAAGQVSLVEASAFDVAVSQTLTITTGGGSSKTFTADSGSLDAVAQAINASGVGVTAVVVRAKASDGVTREYLQMSGASGASNAFTVRNDSTGTVVTSPESAAKGARDAEIELWGSGLTATSTTNTFSEVFSGVEFTVSAETQDGAPDIVLTVESDQKGRGKVAGDLVASITAVLDEISSASKATTRTETDGRSVVTGGLLSGDSAVRFLSDNIRSAVSNPVGGRSPSDVGISFDRYGVLSFDDEKFTKAMADDPGGTEAMMATIAGRVAAVAQGASDSIDGSLTMKIKSQQGLVSDLGRQIEDWDRRLEIRRAGLLRTYSALEVTLGQLQSQQSWLAGQLATLPQVSAGK
jgi:flagellar hook-associated protein 2